MDMVDMDTVDMDMVDMDIVVIGMMDINMVDIKMMNINKVDINTQSHCCASYFVFFMNKYVNISLHWLHLFDFSQLCVFKCVLKLPAREDA